MSREGVEVWLEVLDVIGGDDSDSGRYLPNGNPACDCTYVAQGEIAEIHSYHQFGEKPSL